MENVCEKQDEIDSIISKFSNKRTVERIPKINLAILRLAIYEAIYEENVPVNVAISRLWLLQENMPSSLTFHL